jgi:protein-disulfide isomerase
VGPILRELADAGRIRLVIHDATLPAHNVGAIAAAAAHCAERTGAGWATHEALYRHAPDWKDAADPSHAIRGVALAAARNAGAEISEPDLEACMADETTLRSDAAARERARRFGIAEVPTVIANGNQLRFTSWRALARYIERSVAAP